MFELHWHYFRVFRDFREILNTRLFISHGIHGKHGTLNSDELISIPDRSKNRSYKRFFLFWGKSVNPVVTLSYPSGN
jgi:hypothetical protein